MAPNLEVLPLEFDPDCNVIIGQSHFIKTVEDLAEIMAGSVPGIKWGLAFNEASEPCLIRSEGNDPHLIKTATTMAESTGAGHSFYIVLGSGAYPINVLDRIKDCPEVCRIFCATANPIEVIVAKTAQGSGILGIIDGSSPKGIENENDKATRKAILRKFGYKY